MSSGFMKPLDTMVGVQSSSLSLSRTVMLPSLAAAKPRLYSRRPISQICSFSLYSFMFCLSITDHDPIQQARAERVQRFLVGQERRRRLDTLGEADLAAGAGAQVVVDHQVLAVGLSCFQR